MEHKPLVIMFFLFFAYNKLVNLKQIFTKPEASYKLKNYIAYIKKLFQLYKAGDPDTFNYVKFILNLRSLNIFGDEDKMILQKIIQSALNKTNEYVSSVKKTLVSTDNTPDIYTPAPFSEILSKSISITPSDFVSVSSITNLNRYLISINNNYLSIDSDYNVTFNTDLTTYSDLLTKVFQLVQDSSLNTSYFRIDSDLHYIESLDYDSTTGELVFKNNWGINAASNTGYICFLCENNLLQAKTRYIYNADYSHSLDTDFIYADYYVYYDGNSSSLKFTTDITVSSSFTFYNCPINYYIPSDFNPIPISYQPNDRIELNSTWIANTIDNIESTDPKDPNNKFHKNFSTSSNAGYNYTLQLTNVGYDDSTNGTNYYADQMLSEIYSKVNDQGNSLRYSTDTYKIFREGALQITLGCNGIANGTINMNTVPYVYFTNEKDDSGKYHPFMCLAAFSIADKPNRLLDVCRPPGGGGSGGYPVQDVTRDATLQLYLHKIPMLDYGTVDDINGNVYYDGTNTISSISGNYNIMLNTISYDFINDPTENDNWSGTARYFNDISYNSYNYSSISGIAAMIDGVVIYPVLNNTLNTAHISAEITNTGIHVGQGLGLHYHADGHSADSTNNNLNLYNSFDYTNRDHPPLIGFGFDGIALYGIYETDYSTMDGYGVSLDNFGGHSHDNYGYHYHCHTIVNNASNNIDTNINGAVDYTIHALMKGAWKGNVNNIPEFWDTTTLAPAYSLSQTSQYVWGVNR
jgi:hypothetical protein